jgi:ABC-type branched-subunit amino acid transport system substrate-binding protein
MREIVEKTRRDFLKTGGAVLSGTAMLTGLGKRKAYAAPLKGVPKEPVKIGVIAFQKGTAAFLGIAAWRACQIWRDQINASIFHGKRTGNRTCG